MSISITTLNLTEMLNEALLGQPADILTTIIMPPRMLHELHQQHHRHTVPFPSPLCTSDFPDVMAPRNAVKQPRKRNSSKQQVSERSKQRKLQNCCICLESLTTNEVAELPCKHTFHRLCLFSLVTYPILGSRSMVHCPLCRYALDRHDLRTLGLDVSVRHITTTIRSWLWYTTRTAWDRRCDNLRKILDANFVGKSTSNDPPSRVVAQLIQGCSHLTAPDGFIYNVSLLALHRSLYHRCNLVRSISMQLRNARNAIPDEYDFVQQNLACHIEVLVRTANNVDFFQSLFFGEMSDCHSET